MKRGTSIFALATLFVLVGLFGCAGQTPVTDADVAPEMGSRAPEVRSNKLDNGTVGEAVKLSELRGKPVILNFWATWCEPCREEFPILDEVFRKYRESEQLQVVAVNAQDTATPEAVQQYLAESGVVFPIWLDGDGSANRTYMIQALPTTVFIDANGVIHQVRIGGPLTREYLEQQISKIVTQ